MTDNIFTFIKRDLKNLIQDNLAENGDISRFWLHPCDPDAANYKELCEQGGQTFSSTKVDNYVEIDGIKLATIDCAGERALIFYNSENFYETLAPEEFELYQKNLQFIQRAKFAAKARVKFKSPIPLRVANEEILEVDLDEYFPQLLSFGPEDKDDLATPLASYAKVMLYSEQDKDFIRHLRTNILGLIRAIPTAHHDWLYHQLYSTIRSRKIENAFLGLYKILEFFFPLQNVLELRDKIAFTDSNLSLIRHCIDTLQWHIGHYKGAQSSINFAGCGFAEISLDKTFDRAAEGANSETLEVAERKFKIKAMDVLSNVRHNLTHQNFDHKRYDHDEMLRYCEALIAFLTEAFIKYQSLSQIPGVQKHDAQPTASNPVDAEPKRSALSWPEQ